jgi:hypothetical protein
MKWPLQIACIQMLFMVTPSDAVGQVTISRPGNSIVQRLEIPVQELMEISKACATDAGCYAQPFPEWIFP